MTRKYIYMYIDKKNGWRPHILIYLFIFIYHYFN